MSENENENESKPESFHHIEQLAGDDLLPPIDLEKLDDERRQVYESYEAFLRAQLHALDSKRELQWQCDYTNIESYERSIAPMREKLRNMFGWWVEPSDRKPIEKLNEHVISETDELIATRYQFEILDGLRSYAVELTPKSDGPHRGLTCQHGYAGTPEGVCGFGPKANESDYSYRSMGLRAVRHGFHVIAVLHPTTFGKPDTKSQFPLPGYEQFEFTYGKNRLHRLATMAEGKTLFGLDLMATSRAVDLLLAAGVREQAVGIYGLSQGGQTALYAPAVEPRIHASVCSAFFNCRLPKMIGPYGRGNFLDSSAEDKFFPHLASTFGDSDIVSLVAPRAFAAEVGKLDNAVDMAGAYSEWQKAKVHYEQLGLASRTEFIAHEQGHVSATGRAFEFLKTHLTLNA